VICSEWSKMRVERLWRGLKGVSADKTNRKEATSKSPTLSKNKTESEGHPIQRPGPSTTLIRADPLRACHPPAGAVIQSNSSLGLIVRANDPYNPCSDPAMIFSVQEA